MVFTLKTHGITMTKEILSFGMAHLHTVHEFPWVLMTQSGSKGKWIIKLKAVTEKGDQKIQTLISIMLIEVMKPGTKVNKTFQSG